MRFTLEFLRIFTMDLYYAAPLLLLLVLLIAAIGKVIGSYERWSISDALYYAFITATTVGYGDFSPTRGVSKSLAIVIALLGLLLTGLVVSLGLHAATVAFENAHPQFPAQ